LNIYTFAAFATYSDVVFSFTEAVEMKYYTSTFARYSKITQMRCGA